MSPVIATVPPAGAERCGAAVLEVRAGGAVGLLCRGARLAPRILRRRGQTVHAAFVPTQAGPLAGDRDVTRIVVRARAALVVEPVAATLALPGDATTFITLDVEVGDGGRLVLDEGPLIVAAGASVQRRCSIALAAGAACAVRETLVLGRDGEPAGTLDSALRVTLGARALLHDGLRVGAPAEALARVALPPGHRVTGTVATFGARARPGPGVLALHGPGSLLRATAPSLADVDAAVEEAWRAWSRGVLGARR